MAVGLLTSGSARSFSRVSAARLSAAVAAGAARAAGGAVTFSSAIGKM